ncbi:MULTISPECIES: hypothetical protein [Bacillus]|nr:hypothetical protein [Bacillus pumilus]
MRTAIYTCISLSIVGVAYALTQGDYGLAIHNGINLVLFAFLNRYYG